MIIVQINTKDIGGGAEKSTWNLFQTYRKRGYTSHLVVGYQRSNDPDVLVIPRPQSSFLWSRPCWALHGRLESFDGRLPGAGRLRIWFHTLAGGWPEIDKVMGHEDFNFPESKNLLKPYSPLPDIVHTHNLHGGYFDLRFLSKLSHQVPVVMTLRDEWMFTGHCAYTLGCEQWVMGCGNCPDLTIYPEIRKDATAWNWQRKHKIYRKSLLYVATPSQWLLDRVRRSMLTPLETRVINNGVDLSVYHPADRFEIRARLNLPQNAILLLFAAQNAKKNRFKDYKTIEKAIRQLSSYKLKDKPIEFLVLGSSKLGEEQVGNTKMKFIPFITDPEIVAQYFQASDLFLHAAHADNFPNTILEALACGTPVVATAVGGIPEQIEHGVTGFLVPPGDGECMAKYIQLLLDDETLREKMSHSAVDNARVRFDLDKIADEYLQWYREIIERRKTEIIN